MANMATGSCLAESRLQLPSFLLFLSLSFPLLAGFFRLLLVVVLALLQLRAEKSVFKFQQFNILSPQIVVAAGLLFGVHSNKLLIGCQRRRQHQTLPLPLPPALSLSHLLASQMTLV